MPITTSSSDPRRWLVTGGVGFIGSHLAEALLRKGQEVVVLDDLSTGSTENLQLLEATAWETGARFEFLKGSLEDGALCRAACRRVSYVLHHAALASVPQSLADPARTHSTNLTGTMNLLLAARETGVRRFVQASSSAVYGDDPAQLKREDSVGTPLTPYASTKRTAEFYARHFADHFGLETVSLRYFNIYGPRQDPNGPYAAVIPLWATAMARGETVTIHGNGETTRDFCHVNDVVQANFLAATYEPYCPNISVFNIASGHRTSLKHLHDTLRHLLFESGRLAPPLPANGPERPGDIRHSQADISLAQSVLGYQPAVHLDEGLRGLISL